MTKHYIEPQKNLIAYTCPHCYALSQMDGDIHYFPDDDQLKISPGRVVFNKLTIHRCRCCGKKILWIDDEYIYPDIVAEEANPDMPEPVRVLYNEAGLVYNKSPRAAWALLRLAVDKLCNELGETERDIDKNIGALVKKGLPQSVQQALDSVRVVGNKSVHPGQIAFNVDDKNTAIMLMRLLNIIVARMITDPKEIEEVYKGLPQSVKDAIEKRDKK